MSAYEPTAVLWYEHATMARLMADLAILSQGLPAGGVLRVRTSLREAWDTIPGWCETRGYLIVHKSAAYEGAREGAPSYMSSRYLFDICRVANHMASTMANTDAP